MDLTSSVPVNPKKTVPAYVLGQFKREGVPAGRMRLDLLAYAPPGSTIVGASVGGTAVAPGALKDGPNPVSKVRVEIAPGATLRVTFEMVAVKAGDRLFDLSSTPLVHATAITKAGLDCTTVAKK